MPRTFNRVPYSVPTPSNSDAKDYFFNHYNWKGMSTDKNFLAADQETFEDCNNVYMDSEGLLRSRPSVKNSKLNITGKDAPESLSVVKFWSFSDILIYCNKIVESYDLIFASPEGTYLNSSTGYVSININLIRKDDKIFIFSDTPGKFSYYNISDKSVKSAVNYIYVPEVKVVSYGEEGTGSESPNLLSLAKITTYLYDSSTEINPELNGKEVKVELDGEIYKFTFESDTHPYLLYEKTNLAYNENDYYFVTSTSVGERYVRFSNETGMVYVSYDGITWTKVGNALVLNEHRSVEDCGISKDGLIFYVVVRDESDAYIVKHLALVLSLTDDSSSGKKYSEFTEIEEYSSDIKIKMLSASTYVLLIFNYTAMTDSSVILIRYVIDGQHVYPDPNSGSGTDIQAIFLDGDVDIHDFDFYYVAGKFKVYLYVNGWFYPNLYDGNQSNRYDRYTLDGIYGAHAIDARISASQGLVMVHCMLDLVEYYILFGVDGKQISVIKYITRESDVYDDKFFINEYYNYILTKYGTYSILNKKFYQSLPTHTDTSPLMMDKYAYYVNDRTDSIYSNNITETLALKTTDTDEILNNEFVSKLAKANCAELDNFYFSDGVNLYINSLRKNENGEFLWYFPEVNKQSFSSEITELQPISTTDMAIFLPDEIWYSTYKDGVYYYNKSKLQLGLKKGSDVITSYDGTKVIFPTKRGLVALSYQDFVASTDQVLSFLSDAIHEKIIPFMEQPVKLLRYQFWIFCYREDSNIVYMYDIRNNSWWPLTFPDKIFKMLDVDNKIKILVKENDVIEFFDIDKSDKDYYDSGERKIDWNVKSQKLHLSAINYYKHIANITLYSVLDSDKLMSFKMDVNNYRNKIDRAEIQTVEYKVDAIRTFVKRVSFPKVTEFQYNLHQDDETTTPLPLSLSGLTIKYRIGSQVR